MTWFVSDEAKATYAELKSRWALLDAWGARSKLPNLRPQFQAWDAFRDRWEHGDEDTGALRTMTDEIRLVEKYAEEKGWTRGKDISAPEVTQTTEVLKAAEVIDREARALERAAGKQLKSLPAALGLGAVDALRQLPTSVKVVGGAAVVVAAGAKLARWLPRRRRGEEDR